MDTPLERSKKVFSRGKPPGSIRKGISMVLREWKKAQKKEKNNNISETIINTNPKKKVEMLVSRKFPTRPSLNKSNAQPLTITNPNKNIKEILLRFIEARKKTKTDIILIDTSRG